MSNDGTNNETSALQCLGCDLPSNCVVLGWRGKAVGITMQYRVFRDRLPRRRSSESNLVNEILLPLQIELERTNTSMLTEEVHFYTPAFALAQEKGNKVNSLASTIFRKLEGTDLKKAIFQDIRNNARMKKSKKKDVSKLSYTETKNSGADAALWSEYSRVLFDRNDSLSKRTKRGMTIEESNKDAMSEHNDDDANPLSIRMMKAIAAVFPNPRNDSNGLDNDDDDHKTSDENELDDHFTTIQDIQRLQSACQDGNIDDVKSLLRHPLWIVARDNDGRNAVHYTCAGTANTEIGRGQQHLQILQSLFIFYAVKMDCDHETLREIINTRDNMGRTALMYACAHGHFNIVQYVVSQHGIQVDAFCDNDGRLPLHIACQEGHSNIVQYLIETCHADVNAEDRWGKTPLHYAVCGSKHEESCMIRLDGKTGEECRCNKKTKRENFCQGRCGRCDIVKYLTKHKHVIVDACSNNGCTALHYACGGGRSLFEDCFSERNYAASKLSIMPSYDCHQCFLRIVELLIASGKADVERMDNHGRTALHYAARNGNCAMVTYLIRDGQANANAITNNGLSALHYASQYGYYAVAEYLIKNDKANVTATANDGMTALHFACRNGRFEMARLLKEHGAKVDAKEKNGKTPLHVACEFGNKAIVVFLIDSAFANVTATSNSGWTAFHFACSKGFTAVVVLLYRTGNVIVEAVTNDGKTALHLACEYGLSTIVDYLIKECKANIDATTKDGSKPYLSASRNDFLNIAKNIHAERNRRSNAARTEIIPYIEDKAQIMI